MRKFLFMMSAVALLVGGAIAASAATIDFGIVAPTSGTISYAGGANPLVGTDIQVDNFVGLDTPLNSGVVFDFVDLGYEPALLNFVTGNLNSSTSNTWYFSGGGSISIDLPTYGNLLSGTFNNVMVTAIGGTFKIAGASFADTKDEGLLELLGLPTDIGYSGGFNISFSATGAGGSAFVSDEVFSGDVVNEPVPEPGTMMLLGSGLIGLAGWGRKKFRK